MEDWQTKASEFVGPSYERGDATGWFDRLYAAGAAGEVSMPWDRDEPHPLLHEWAERERVSGDGRRGVVVGCGLGGDAEYLARLGFDTIGFDIAPTAVQVAKERHPGSGVDYRIADLLGLPGDWEQAFDQVVEIFTLQALPDPPRADAIRGVNRLVRPGGTLLMLAFRAIEGDDPMQGPPFSLTRDTIDALAFDGLQIAAAEEVELDGTPLWRVEYHR